MNKKYMGHSFKYNEVLFIDYFSTYKQRPYQCLICNCKIMYMTNSSSYLNFNEDVQGWVRLNLTCDEMIIKNIIE